ncbi:succinate dehydrogenase / fumarate reductase cytochrome b subunit [Catalinimonas alkaloidigena]|uniref:succinate dehydrogenase cytochrome b subunit n=1 Tax=Catalinimonas alkaloidigena TaxID=1075417 RepID=UPI002406490F|nr:succinate dehydrogenase cytochrome b subunit [Catalinimonas alkaloidigena]MDF9797542.1 succinate dehydrogenase / fumarate reductase cytochrome b subunit [Catalinimonas alkaloidigena]
MSWFTKALSSTIGRKVIMSLTGLFLITFLIVHLSGNMLLFKSDGGEAFNLYADFMTTSPLIQIASYILYTGIILHVVYSLVLSVKNKNARPVGYKLANPNQNSSWRSRNMGILGTIVLIFLIIHLRSFWYEMHFGELPTKTYAGGEVKDLYTIVQAAFSEWWYSLLYVLAMLGLAFHLSHGFWSAFQTLGLSHKKYTPFIKTVGLIFAIVVPLLFASMPVYFYLQSL